MKEFSITGNLLNSERKYEAGVYVVRECDLYLKYKSTHIGVGKMEGFFKALLIHF